MSESEIPRLSSFQYELPVENIAQYPLAGRADSKLLIFKNGNIQHSSFKNLDKYIPEKSLLFINDTKVIPARLIFNKPSGGKIELFILHPHDPVKDINQSMQIRSRITWQCMIGNLKKWKDHQPLQKSLVINKVPTVLTASLVNRHAQLVEFSWDNEVVNFADIVTHFGKTPLPPYIQREAEEIDKPRYQTIYSQEQGAVAAPTAGLHFDKELLEKLRCQHHHIERLTLHVGAGTFQPIKHESVIDHPMHQEQFGIPVESLKALLKYQGSVIAVGTTSMRTLESVYWLGVKFIANKTFDPFLEKLFPYQIPDADLPSKAEAIEALVNYMDHNGIRKISGETQIMIYPGYPFKICRGLITNFHMSGSSLILLVAAFIGPKWREIYDQALQNKYRFLSYGDSSLLLPD